MDCLAPVKLKNGLAVPCGKCALCRSNARNEWSIRLAIHLMNCDRMPMFVTLTYDDKHVPTLENGLPTLQRSDVSSFLKAYKRKYGLTNEKFQYFGCGEYGENFRRPHYHLLLFGDTELYNEFFRDSDAAYKRVGCVWKNGFVHVCVAGYDGIHYVTKYCLKDDIELIPDECVSPFTIASNGLGMNFLNSKLGKRYKSELLYLTKNKDLIMSGCPALDVDCENIKDVIRYLQKYIPRFDVVLDDGRQVFLPRAIRRKLIGSFEHFKDSPLWFYHHLTQLCKSIKYYSDYCDYDNEHDLPMSLVKCLNRVEKIRKRLLEKKYNNKFKKL